MKLSCHCGAVSIETASPAEQLTSCNCSICRRYASLWGYFPPEEIEIEAPETGTSSYRWAEGYLDFVFCNQCGCLTHYLTTDKVPTPKVGVNFRMADPTEIKDTQIRRFDGADTWKYLD